MTTSRRHVSTPAQLAALLTRPAECDAPFEPALRAAFLSQLADLAPRRGRRLRLDSFVVEHGSSLRATPFAWSVRASRRSLGTRAARRVASGEEPSVLVAASNEIERQCDRARRGLVAPGALGSWLAASPPSLRAACAVEAASWASRLLVLVAPERTGVRVGIADAWFDVPGAPVTLHARRDGVSSTGSGGRHGVLRLTDGIPGPRASDGLVVDGLVNALASRDDLAPTRVVGIWPDAGVAVSVELDRWSLERGTRLLAEAAGEPPDAKRSTELVAA